MPSIALPKNLSIQPIKINSPAIKSKKPLIIPAIKAKIISKAKLAAFINSLNALKNTFTSSFIFLRVGSKSKPLLGNTNLFISSASILSTVSKILSGLSLFQEVSFILNFSISSPISQNSFPTLVGAQLITEPIVLT